ncbi:MULTISPECIES: Imm50 family immunity protein [Pseudomonas]|uniref:Immunity protein 50 n=1 Tax=Pseudomonas brassicacearum TaxID=930166 RepID=A0AAJ3FZX1_9PSED|nr:MULTISPECIES: Imm50 family immunity protein [Pseudomonas]NUT82867.1 hypothetical protein [Pseudomonas brassicacearum]QGA47883.1 hypothetical protein GFU70_01715 [Pseudomonas brassicacearum]
MNFWNDLEGSTFFNKIFSSPVPIGTIELFSLAIDNDTSTIVFEFDIEEYPDAPPHKWKQSGFNTCRIGLNCSAPTNLTITNIPTKNKLALRISQQQNTFTVHASNDTSLIKFETKHLLLCGPSAYQNIAEQI